LATGSTTTPSAVIGMIQRSRRFQPTDSSSAKASMAMTARSGNAR